jgi:hypothetical protein
LFALWRGKGEEMGLSCLRSGILLGLAAVAVSATMSGNAAAQQSQAEKAIRPPLRKLVLFRSGVGFFEHQVEGEGDVTLELEFDVEEINDVLKSMTAKDLNGGHVSAARYSSQAPLSRLLDAYMIDLTDNPSLVDLLKQIRGHRVEVHVLEWISGTIVSVEDEVLRPVADGDGHHQILRQLLNLQTDEGIRSIPLQTISRIRLEEEELARDFTAALETLALARDTDSKRFEIRAQAQGRRQIRIGYLRAMPVWKMTYRLSLSDEDGTRIEGWAIAENTTDRDWKDVTLKLVSGRPISYVMPLYEPLFLDRPQVELELYRSLRPQRYEQALGQPKEQEVRKAEAVAGRQRGQAADAARAPTAVARTKTLADGDARSDLAKGVQSVAQAETVGELFEYRIQDAVTLAAHRSAMLPVVSQQIKVEKLSIYDQSVHAKYPLHGARLTNSTDLFLMQGPVTVFEQGTYAGEGLMSNLPADGEGLVTYALALDLEVDVQSESSPRRLTQVRIVKKTLHTTHKRIREDT